MIANETLNNYKNKTAQYFNLSADLIFSRIRDNVAIEPRRFLIVYLKDKYKLSLTGAGKLFEYDHSTILHHVRKHSDYLETDKKYKNNYFNYIAFMNNVKDLYADNNDLSLLITKFEEFNNNEFNIYYNELKEILKSRNIEINIFEIIRSLLLKSKVSEYTLNNNRLYSFKEIANIVLKDKRTAYLSEILTYNQIVEIGFVILQAKHIASINKIRIELESTSTELILEKYIDCLNYYILYELYLNAL